MQLIRVSRNGSKVMIGLSTGLPHADAGSTTRIEFEYNCNHVFMAELLRRHAWNELCNSIEAARREAYEQGWKDAKAHRSKQTWFSALLTKD